MRVFLYFVFFFLVVPTQSAGAEPWGPWSASTDAPAILSRADRSPSGGIRPEQPAPGIAATPFLWLLSFYQKTIGPVNSGRCPMYPTCSQYSVEAIRKHGPVIGIVMTADRLIHEHDEQNFATWIQVGGRHRFHDPVRNNDFWWHAE